VSGAALPHPPQVRVVAGEVACGAAPLVFTTILGSCVAVCLWDAVRRQGGLNHFVLPHDRGGWATARCGTRAMTELLHGLAALGSPPTALQAKLFGGADVLAGGSPATSVGAANVRFALGFLREHGIPVTARRTGGHSGVTIRFDIGNGEVLVRRLANAAVRPTPAP